MESMRKPLDIFDKSKNPRSRQQLIDFDYLDKLSDTDKEWLAKFADEYYGASFKCNPAFMKRLELITLAKSHLDNPELSQREMKRWEGHLSRAEASKKKFIQISENENKSHNVDLRKCRSNNVYYKTGSNTYVASKDYRYSEDNILDINNRKVRKELNDRANAQKSCILGSFGANDIDNYELDIEQFSPEQYLLFNEAAEEQEKLDSLD